MTYLFSFLFYLSPLFLFLFYLMKERVLKKQKQNKNCFFHSIPNDVCTEQECCLIVLCIFEIMFILFFFLFFSSTQFTLLARVDVSNALQFTCTPTPHTDGHVHARKSITIVSIGKKHVVLFLAGGSVSPTISKKDARLLLWPFWG